MKMKPDGTPLDRLTAQPFPEMTSAVLLHTVAVKDACLFPHVVALEPSRDVVALPNEQTAQTTSIMQSARVSDPIQSESERGIKEGGSE